MLQRSEQWSDMVDSMTSVDELEQLREDVLDGMVVVDVDDADESGDTSPFSGMEFGVDLNEEHLEDYMRPEHEVESLSLDEWNSRISAMTSREELEQLREDVLNGDVVLDAPDDFGKAL